jgi:two-component system sensor histidine kinase YesM
MGHSRSDVEGIYVVTRSGTLFSWRASGDLVQHPKTLDALWYRRALAADPRVVFLPTGNQEMVSVATGKVFSVAATLHDRRTNALLGAVRIDLDAGVLASVVQRISLGLLGRLLVVAPDGQVVYPIDPSASEARLAQSIVAERGPNTSGRLQLNVGDTALLATYNTSASSGWIVAGVVPVEQLLSGTNHLRSLILSVAVVCILAGALFATFIIGRLTRPLADLRNAMLTVEAHGDLDTRLKVKSDDEVGQLAHGFNTMLDEIRRLVDDVLRAQIHEREAELTALQNQINPHFLYNTLESINMLALTHGDRDISRMVTSLGRLLRLSISSSDVLLPLRYEVDYVNHYLIVQRTRYGDRISMTVDVDDALLDFTLPKLTLQPVVENALYHGLEPQRGPGHVTVRGRLVDNELELTVEDDGVGMDAFTLETVQRSLQEGTQREGRSVGLANVHERLKLYCGPAYGLTVRSKPGEGTTVSFRIPPVLRIPENRSATKVDEPKENSDVSPAHSR